MSVLALVPARKNSKGIPGKNFRPLAGRSPMNRAIDCTNACVAQGIINDFYVSSDVDWAANERFFGHEPAYRIGHWLLRPAELAQDDTPMLAVVQHALAQIPGPPDQIIVLLQPTQPFREPRHVQAAIRLLQETQADSVVSVVELPSAYSPEMVLYVGDGYVVPWLREYGFSHCDSLFRWVDIPARRQDAKPAYRRDGTVYAFYRKTVEQHGSIYGCGRNVVPLIIPPDESCELDSEQQWQEVERRWAARQLNGDRA